MTFKELQDDALERCGYDFATASTEPRTRIKRWINQWHRRLLSDKRFTKLRDAKAPLATVANQFLYGIPPSIEKIDRIADTVLNNPQLVLRDQAWLRALPQAEIATGTPQYYVPLGLHAITRFPASTGTGIWVASSSAADTTQTVRMEGIRVGGYPLIAGPATVNGVTRVQVGARTDWVDLTRLFLSAVCAGDLTIYDAAAAGNALGVIPIGQTSARYNLVQLFPVPSSVITYTVFGKLKFFDLVQDTDEPLWPYDYHYGLALAAHYQELATVKKQLAQANLMYKQDLEPLVYDQMLDYVVNSADLIVVPFDGRRGSARAQGSNLGSYYPAGRW